MRGPPHDQLRAEKTKYASRLRVSYHNYNEFSRLVDERLIETSLAPVFKRRVHLTGDEGRRQDRRRRVVKSERRGALGWAMGQTDAVSAALVFAAVVVDDEVFNDASDFFALSEELNAGQMLTGPHRS